MLVYWLLVEGCSNANKLEGTELASHALVDRTPWK